VKQGGYWKRYISLEKIIPQNPGDVKAQDPHANAREPVKARTSALVCFRRGGKIETLSREVRKWVDQAEEEFLLSAANLEGGTGIVRAWERDS